MVIWMSSAFTFNEGIKTMAVKLRRQTWVAYPYFTKFREFIEEFNGLSHKVKSENRRIILNGESVGGVLYTYLASNEEYAELMRKFDALSNNQHISLSKGLELNVFGERIHTLHVKPGYWSRFKRKLIQDGMLDNVVENNEVVENYYGTTTTLRVIKILCSKTERDKYFDAYCY